ncbi:hypothetical protein R1sor_021793 [Riccia sorocarpa]|uniref:Reverse transcriptase zinc-binding domain-containing protein n=1 Tax=Riccia sorocarpa TaxID=122646 RepID=A0ABD3GJZ0_9MARC
MIPGAQTASGLLATWNAVKKLLKLDRNNVSITGEASVDLYLELAEISGSLSQEDATCMRKQLHKEKIKTTGQWKDWAWKENAQRPLMEQRQLVVEHGLVLNVESRTAAQLEWRWQLGHKQLTGWSLTTRTCKQLLAGKPGDCAALNRKWGTSDSARRWAKRFTKIWKSLLPPRDKSWLWKLVQHGFPTLMRAIKWHPEESEMCSRCNDDRETHNDLFWECRRKREVWQDYQYLTEEGPVSESPPGNMLEAIDRALSDGSAARLFPVVAIFPRIWQDRNSITYAGKEVRTPVTIPLKKTLTSATALRKGLADRSRKGRKLKDAIHTLEKALTRAGTRGMTWKASLAANSATRKFFKTREEANHNGLPIFDDVLIRLKEIALEDWNK